MKDIFLLYPHQLFENINRLKNKKVLLIEEPLFFRQFKFHIQKLVLHRASMKYYHDYLISNNIEVEYFEDESYLNIYNNTQIHVYDVADDWLMKKILKHFKNRTIYHNPNFLNVNDDSKFLHSYYINRRKENNIFIENGKPYGGKWSFDHQNRKKLSKDHIIPNDRTYTNRYIDEAIKYVKKFNTYGEVKNFYYPITHEEAKQSFEKFLKEKFTLFGDYQDAISSHGIYLYHSNISSSLNIGLIDLDHIIQEVINSCAPFNAKEGYIRQIIGWREFMFNLYKSSHISLRNSNYFEFTNKIPKKLINGSSGINVLDDAIKKLKISAYNHHIERLMIIGNLFMLLEIDPNEVYKFFMAHYIDAYDWVMIGNVYAMICYCDGGQITTKPYISSSNYIIKMTNDYKKSEAWTKIWDGLYWRFINKYKHKFDKNPRMTMQIKLVEKMDPLKLQEHIKNAENFIKSMK